MIRALYAIAVLFLWCPGAFGQQIVSHSFPSPSFAPASDLKTGWWTCEPIRNAEPGLCKSLTDIESHIHAGHDTRYPNRVTWAHETTHAINARIRNNIGVGVNALYCLNNWAGVFREPRFNKRLVCRYVPANLRGRSLTWNLYMASGDNDECPLYILDEWVAYINGATVAQEIYGSARLGPGGDVLTVETEAAIEFAGYSSALLRCIEANDPGYPDKEQLTKFIAYNVKRTLELTKAHPHPQQMTAFAMQFFQGDCRSGNCQPSWSGGRWSQPQYQPPQPIRSVAPAPPLRPVTPQPAAKPQIVKGDKGDKGDQGPRGLKGDAGTCDETKVAALEKRITDLEAQLAGLKQACESSKDQGAEPRPQPFSFDIVPRLQTRD